MKFSELTYQDIFDSIEKFAEDYGDFLDQQCVTEIRENFYEDFVNVTFSGMTKDEANMFDTMLEAMIQRYVDQFYIKSK